MYIFCVADIRIARCMARAAFWRKRPGQHLAVVMRVSINTTIAALQKRIRFKKCK